MRVTAEGFSTFEVPIRVHNPKAKCKASLEVTLSPEWAIRAVPAWC